MSADNDTHDLDTVKTTVNVLFFARLREKMGQADYQIMIDQPLTLAEFKVQLAQHLPLFEHLTQPVMTAINQDFAQDTHMIYADDEVAFFPPVTGG